MRRPNFCPVRSLNFAWHPQLLVRPLTRLETRIVFCLPHSHWHSHLAFPARSLASREITVSLPNCFPVKSIRCLPISSFFLGLRHGFFYLLTFWLPPGLYTSTALSAPVDKIHAENSFRISTLTLAEPLCISYTIILCPGEDC